MGEYKGLKQIAEEIGVSKQAVYKRYTGKLYEQCKEHVHTENVKLMFDEEAVRILKKDFTDNPSAVVEEESAAVCDELRAENSDLKHIITEKDKKIAVLKTKVEGLESLLSVLKADKFDLQRHRDNLTEALMLSKGDIARLERILTQMASLSLGTRVFKWSGTVKALTDEAMNADNILEEKGIITDASYEEISNNNAAGEGSASQ